MKKLLHKMLRKQLGLHNSEQLQIILSHQQINNNDTKFLASIRHELLKVISRHVQVDLDQMQVSLEQKDNCATLQLNIKLPMRKERAHDPLANVVKVIR